MEISTYDVAKLSPRRVSVPDTGYLQDILLEFSSKRKRLRLFPQDHQVGFDDYPFDNLTTNCWTSNFIKSCCNDFDTGLSQITKCDTISGMVKASDEETISETYDSLSSSQKGPDSHDDKEALHCLYPKYSPETTSRKIMKKRHSTKVVYPFAVVKPGGFEGHVTLRDINKRILMPPTRPVRHPVGDFACRPLVSPDGPGLSGKAVVAFTRIHTKGCGTITIIRTRG